MWTLTFWRAVLERALKTAAQTAVATIGTTAIAADAVDWRTVGLVSATATVLSVLTSIATAVTTDGSPSLNGSEVVADWGTVQYVTGPETIVQPVSPEFSVAYEDGSIATHYSNGTIQTDPGIGNPPTASLS